MKRILGTSNDATLTLLRLVTGVVLFAHGAQKMLGWFGGYGFRGTMQFFTGTMHLPAVLAFLAIAAEFFGSLALVSGFLGRVAAAGIATNMLVALALVHAKFGFFMNWNGSQKGEGFEYHLLVLAIAATLIVRGSGAFSLDRLLSRETRPRAVVPESTPIASLRKSAAGR